MGFPVRKTKKLCYARIKMYFLDMFDPKCRLKHGCPDQKIRPKHIRSTDRTITERGLDCPGNHGLKCYRQLGHWYSTPSIRLKPWWTLMILFSDASQKKGPTRKMFKHEKCRICGEQASGFNYRVVSCNACKGIWFTYWFVYMFLT